MKNLKDMPEKNFTVINGRNQWLCCNEDAVWFWVDNPRDGMDHPLNWHDVEIKDGYLEIDDVSIEVREDMTLWWNDVQLTISYDKRFYKRTRQL
jgi:hypothetical protein